MISEKKKTPKKRKNQKTKTNKKVYVDHRTLIKKLLISSSSHMQSSVWISIQLLVK